MLKLQSNNPWSSPPRNAVGITKTLKRDFTNHLRLKHFELQNFITFEERWKKIHRILNLYQFCCKFDTLKKTGHF